jgi:hypothetical protein
LALSASTRRDARVAGGTEEDAVTSPPFLLEPFPLRAVRCFPDIPPTSQCPYPLYDSRILICVQQSARDSECGVVWSERGGSEVVSLVCRLKVRECMSQTVLKRGEHILNQSHTWKYTIVQASQHGGRWVVCSLTSGKMGASVLCVWMASFPSPAFCCWATLPAPLESDFISCVCVERMRLNLGKSSRVKKKKTHHRPSTHAVPQPPPLHSPPLPPSPL